MYSLLWFRDRYSKKRLSTILKQYSTDKLCGVSNKREVFLLQEIHPLVESIILKQSYGRLLEKFGEQITKVNFYL